MKLLICLTGNNFSRKFILSFSDLIANKVPNDQLVAIITPQIQENDLYTTYNHLFTTNGDTDRPFSIYEYDYVLLCDEALTYFDSGQLDVLLSFQVDCISGFFQHQSIFSSVKKDNKIIPVNKDLCEEFLNKGKRLVELESTHLRFTLLSKKLLDSLEYPWFRQFVWNHEESGKTGIFDFESSFSLSLKQANFKIFFSPMVIIL